MIRPPVSDHDRLIAAEKVRHAELSGFVAGCVIECGSLVADVDLDDLAPGSDGRRLVEIVARRHVAGQSTDTAVLLGLPEVKAVGHGAGGLLHEAVVFGTVRVSVLPTYVAEARALAAADGIRRSLENGRDPAALAALVERMRPKGTGPDGFVSLASIAEREIEWWWPGRLAMANVVVIAGDGGVGKSTLAQAIASAITVGWSLPGSPAREPRGAVIMTAEEDTSAIVRPRMRLMGADLDAVAVIDPDDDDAGLTFPAAIARLERRCTQIDAGVVVVDTGPSFMEKGQSAYAESDVRRFLRPLRGLAERHRLMPIVLVHLNKGEGRQASHRVMGGAAWRNVPRQLLIVGPPPGQDARECEDRLIVVDKSNLGIYPPAFSFVLRPAPEDSSRAVIGWGREVEGIRSADVLGDRVDEQDRSDRAGAADFLRAELADGHQSVADLKAAATVAGVAWRTVERAKAATGVTARKLGFNGGWVWEISQDFDPKAAKAANSAYIREDGGLRSIESPSLDQLDEWNRAAGVDVDEDPSA